MPSFYYVEYTSDKKEDNIVVDTKDYSEVEEVLLVNNIK